MDTNNTLRAQHYDEKNVFRTSEGLRRLVFDLLKNNRFFMRCTDDYKTQKQFKGFCEEVRHKHLIRSRLASQSRTSVTNFLNLKTFFGGKNNKMEFLNK